MKTLLIIGFAVVFPSSLLAQYADRPILLEANTKPNWMQYSRNYGLSSEPVFISPQHEVHDTLLYDSYGNLLDDNPAYTPKRNFLRPIAEIIADNTFTNLLDTYVLGNTSTHVGFESWGNHLKAGVPWGPGWEWDEDRFGVNFFLHPYGGSLFFNSARSNGFGFYESYAFTLLGSYMWKIFGETGVPERNDLFCTTASGALLGEMSYRLSSYFLDDRTTGAERVCREVFAGLIDPSRAFNRMLEGDPFRITSAEIYEKEPLDLTFAAGAHDVNNGRSFGTGATSDMLTLQLDYGNPFEVRSRKVFDYFNLRADLTFGAGRKIVDNVMGDGMLFGHTVEAGKSDMLIGAFQHYDYWDNKTFELGTIAFGGGIISKIPVSDENSIFIDFHLAGVPFAGSSTQLGPDTSQVRDYNFGGGAESKCETSYNIAGFTKIAIKGYYYWIHTFIGLAGNNFIGILKPSVTFTVVKNMSLGFEQLIYYDDRYQQNGSAYHDVRTEQKIFVQLYINNFKKVRVSDAQ